MTNKTTNTPLFKVKCIDGSSGLTLGKEYDVVGVEVDFYTIENDNGTLQSYFQNRFEIVETPLKDKQEFSVGDKVVINKISLGAIINHDKNVKVGDIAIVVRVGNSDIEVSNQKWLNNWWFHKTDVSFLDNPLDNNLLSHQEVVQAIIDGKELEMQYKTGKWVNVISTKTTLHQLSTLNFRLKPSLEDKRKAVIKKLLESKVAVLCKCWDDVEGEDIVAITKVDDDFVYSYMNRNSGYKNAYAIDDNGNEITNV